MLAYQSVDRRTDGRSSLHGGRPKSSCRFAAATTDIGWPSNEWRCSTPPSVRLLAGGQIRTFRFTNSLVPWVSSPFSAPPSPDGGSPPETERRISDFDQLLATTQRRAIDRLGFDRGTRAGGRQLPPSAAPCVERSGFTPSSSRNAPAV